MKKEVMNIQVHPLLIEEFKVMKKEIEEVIGYKINGGMPIVSKIVAIQLKYHRENSLNKLEVFSQKVRGEKKITLSVPSFDVKDLVEKI